MITAIELHSRDRMVHFCQAVQKMCPVGSYIRPEPGGVAGGGGPVRTLAHQGSLCGGGGGAL